LLHLFFVFLLYGHICNVLIFPKYKSKGKICPLKYLITPRIVADGSQNVSIVKFPIHQV